MDKDLFYIKKYPSGWMMYARVDLLFVSYNRLYRKDTTLWVYNTYKQARDMMIIQSGRQWRAA